MNATSGAHHAEHLRNLANELAHAAHAHKLMVDGLIAMLDHSAPSKEEREAITFDAFKLTNQAQELAEEIDPR